MHRADRDDSRRAGWYADFADGTLRLVELDYHFGPQNMEGPGRTDSRTRAAVGASFFIPFHFMPSIFDEYPVIFEIFHPLLEVPFGPGNFKNHYALFPGKNFSIQDIENEVEFFYQVADQWCMDHGFGKTKNKYL